EEQNFDLGLKAARQALERSGIDKNELGLLVVATFSPDYATPSQACMIHEALELSATVAAFDINAACSGFLFALKSAAALLLQDDKKYALIVGSEKISSKLDFTDRSTCVLFGDGAGAAVITTSEDAPFAAEWGSLGNKEGLYCSYNRDDAFVHMDGQSVFKSAVRTMSECAETVLAKAGLTLEEIPYVVCHQANERIIKSVMKHLGGSEEQFFVNIDKYGNTSAASIPIALNELKESGLVKSGDKVLCVAFGAGFTHCGLLVTF
ncbi:MAG: beta-ketoacyl-ACP synthase 3, partial [Lachnospiraceae bacterium]|nr:beta-ketoacyl-ACP synthase 3 [Lachnospiraceae bacterium]